MKKILIAFAFLLALPVMSYAQSADKDIAAGKAVFDKLQSKTVTCAQLADTDFDSLGDYYMGQTMGNSYGAMDTLMEQRLGSGNNALMHIAVGKRLSGCEPNAAFPAQGSNFLPMMGYSGTGMMGGWGWPMMGYYGFGGGAGIFGWIWMIAAWALIALGLVTVIRWLIGERKNEK